MSEPKKGKAKKGRVKSGSISLPVYKHGDSWRFAWKDDRGEWKYVTRKDEAELRELAREKARKIHNGSASSDFAPDQIALLRRVLKLGITHAELDGWESSRKRTLESPTVAETIAAMIKAKANASGGRRRVHDTLESNLSTLPQDRKIAEIQPADIEAWLDSARTRKVKQRTLQNLRASAVTLFRWAQSRKILPPDIKTAPEQTEYIAEGRVRKDVVIYTPDELAALIQACRSLPGEASSMALLIVMGAFAGLRTEEMAPLSETKDEGVQWEDVDRERDIIRVRSHVAKTGDGRVLPLQPNLKAWLEELNAPKSGPIMSAKLPAAMKWLRKLHPGLWKKNALRHSYGTYRTAQTQDMPRVSLEMGNSVEMIKKHYFEAVSEAQGREWFKSPLASVISSYTR